MPIPARVPLKQPGSGFRGVLAPRRRSWDTVGALDLGNFTQLPWEWQSSDQIGAVRGIVVRVRCRRAGE